MYRTYVYPHINAQLCTCQAHCSIGIVACSTSVTLGCCTAGRCTPGCYLDLAVPLAVGRCAGCCAGCCTCCCTDCWLIRCTVGFAHRSSGVHPEMLPQSRLRIHARTNARTNTHMHTRTHAHTHARTRTGLSEFSKIKACYEGSKGKRLIAEAERELPREQHYTPWVRFCRY